MTITVLEATPSPANLPVYPAYNNPSIAVSGSYAGETNWPQQYWPTSGFGSSSQALLLNCLGTSASTTPPANDPTEIYFVATQRATQTILKSGCSQSDYATTNPCTQVVAQSPQETYEYPSGSGMWQPQLPIKIVGQGFGTLPPSLGLPYAVQSSPYIEIADNGAGVNGFKWDTGNDTGGEAQCQIYVTNWTDSSISLVANAPIEDTDPINSSLSLLLDISPDTLTPRVQQGLNAFNCPVVGNDGMTFTVTNPQTRSSTTLLPTVNVQPLGTSPN